jgi:hypothetical protein
MHHMHAALVQGFSLGRSFEGSHKTKDCHSSKLHFKEPSLRMYYVENSLQMDRISEASARTEVDQALLQSFRGQPATALVSRYCNPTVTSKVP